jgi:hydroxyacylglutathione hydrolase
MTHHHHDHVGGVAELKAKWGCTVVGNAADAARLPALDSTVSPGQSYDFSGHQAHIIDTPGHTVGHIAWHFADDQLLFAGDTLFALGCGRVFEGTFEQCGRRSPGSRRCRPNHRLLRARVHPGQRPVCAHRRSGEFRPDASAPRRSTSSDRAAPRRCRPPSGWSWRPIRSCRADDPAIRRRLKLEGASDAEVFAEIRRRKDAA